jgi:uncharacterized membrane protein
VSFGDPLWLLLLLLLPGFVLLARRSRSGLEPGRAIVATALRALLFAALVLALADARHVSRSHRTATMFLLDHSFSVPHDVQRQAFAWIQDRLRELPKGDLAGVVVFGEDAMIETSPAAAPELSGPTSMVARAATDLGAAIRLALAVMPAGYQKRLVLVSDGNENKGHAMPEVELARTQKAVIDVLPLRYEHPSEAWIEALHVPTDVLPREPFDLTAVVNSTRESPARLSIYRNGKLLGLQEVRLSKGKNLFTLKQKVEEAGSFAYEALIEMPGDQVGSNNTGHAFAHARGEARIALVGGDPADLETLASGLRAEGLAAGLYAPEDLSSGRLEPAAFDAVIVANVEALRLGTAGMRSLEAAVHDAGVGFVMIGGENAYGPGGYRGTPVEELLPVTMEQPQRRVLPNGALCLVLHTCEIAEGNYWAKQIAMASLNVLGPRDYMGVLDFGINGDQWVFPLQPVADKEALKDLIQKASPGDMPGFDGTLKMAHQALAQSPAASRHVVIISDADPSGPSRDLVAAMVKDRITITTVAIGPHGASDVEKMAAVARFSGGRFYEVTDPSKLPQIFIKEAATLQRSMIIEGSIPPAKLSGSDALRGIPDDGLPLLLGYTLTTPKPLSRVSLGALVPKDGGASDPKNPYDALLVEWTHGLGRAVAFTSDAKPRWARHWVAWEHYRKFWSQLVRSVLRTVPRSPYAVETEIQGGKGRVRVDAVDAEGRFIHTLQFQGSVTSPGGQKLPLAFRQIGPGRYEAEFDATAVGIYHVQGTFEGPGGEKGYLAQGLPLSYAAEYRDLKYNPALLSRIQERSGGRRLTPDTPVFIPLPEAAGLSEPLWPALLLLVLVLLPLDVFVRRVAVDWGSLAAAAAARFRRAPRQAPAAELPENLRQLVRAKEGVRAAVELKPVDDGTEIPVVGEPPKAPPPAAVPEPPPAPPSPPAAPAGDFLGRLLDAKKRSQKPKE